MNYPQGAMVPHAGGGLQVANAQYVARRNFFNFLGIKCEIRSPEGALMHFVHMKAFKLKEDITVYADLQKQQPLLNIRARQILDFSAAYDVFDVTSGQRVGALRRQGLKSILRDEWHVLDTGDIPVGAIREDSMMLAIIRRFLSNLVPQNYSVTPVDSEQPFGTITGTWNPFIVKYDCNFTAATQYIDARLLLAGVVLLMCIEGKQN